MKNYKLILIAGAGQNVGKTTLACDIIQQLNVYTRVNAIKVAGHHHTLTSLQPVIYRSDGLIISKETNAESGKDTSRYIRAGAQNSYFVLCNEAGINELVLWIDQHLSDWVVCESGIVGKSLVPDLAFFLEGEELLKQPSWTFKYQTLKMVNNEFNPPVKNLFEPRNYEND